MRGAQVHDAQVKAGLSQSGGLIDQRRQVAVCGDAKMCGDHDLRRVPSDLGAMGVEHLSFLVQDLDAAAGEVPVLGPAGDGTEGALLSAAADAQRRVRALDGLGLAAGRSGR